MDFSSISLFNLLLKASRPGTIITSTGKEFHTLPSDFHMLGKENIFLSLFALSGCSILVAVIWSCCGGPSCSHFSLHQIVAEPCAGKLELLHFAPEDHVTRQPGQGFKKAVFGGSGSVKPRSAVLRAPMGSQLGCTLLKRIVADQRLGTACCTGPSQSPPQGRLNSNLILLKLT